MGDGQADVAGGATGERLLPAPDAGWRIERPANADVEAIVGELDGAVTGGVAAAHEHGRQRAAVGSDLDCHLGYFSLLLAPARTDTGVHALQ